MSDRPVCQKMTQSSSLRSTTPLKSDTVTTSCECGRETECEQRMTRRQKQKQTNNKNTLLKKFFQCVDLSFMLPPFLHLLIATSLQENNTKLITGLEVREKASRVLFLFPKPLTQKNLLRQYNNSLQNKQTNKNTHTQTRARHHTQTDKLFVYNFY